MGEARLLKDANVRVAVARVPSMPCCGTLCGCRGITVRESDATLSLFSNGFAARYGLLATSRGRYRTT